MSYRIFFIFLILLSVLTFHQKDAPAQEIAIVQNFADPEIDSLVSYINSMGISNTVFSKDTLKYSSIASYELLIWDDLGFQANGLSDSNVSVFNQFYQTGKPIYFIGDDLAYSIINLSTQWAAVWTGLIHLSGVNNFSQAYNVLITNTTHPVTNGLYGQVNSFDYSLDIDLATRTNTGEVLLGNTTDSDVLLAYAGSQTRTVSQNCTVIQAGSQQSINERKKLFKNAVRWLLFGNIGIRSIGSGIPNKFDLSQNYPNPFNPSTNIRYDIPKNSFVQLIVFDLLGRKIETLVNEKQTTGIYEVSFNGGNMTSGIYFYKLSADGFSETKKMMLLK